MNRLLPQSERSRQQKGFVRVGELLPAFLQEHPQLAKKVRGRFEPLILFWKQLKLPFLEGQC